jgi:glucosyl-3-phosphoglycerate phosphatase
MSRHYPPLYILRHGETEWNRSGRLQGHLDSPLTELGRQQAVTQNEILKRHAPADAVAISSDSERSVLTAQLALAGLAMPLALDARLREVALGQWQGMTVAEIRHDWSDLIGERDPFDWKFDAPGGESLGDLAARARAVLDELSGPTVIVTHGLTSRVLRCLALGRPPEELGTLPGGQGMVHVVEEGQARVLAP